MRRSCFLISAAFCCSACGDHEADKLDASIDADARADAAPPDVAIPAGMIAIGATTFVMGCNQALDGNCQADELPAHDVTLSPYFIDRNEVTQADYQVCASSGSCTPPTNTGVCIGVYDPAMRALHPVTCVTWDQANAYCQYAGKRLPTEAEWELAARGTDRRTYPWGEGAPTCTLVNYNGANGCSGMLDDVGAHAPGASPYGLLDMAGNAREWVADRYAVDYYTSSPMMDPTGPTSGLDHIARENSAGSTLTSALRTSERSLGGATAFEGFRCARSAQ